MRPTEERKKMNAKLLVILSIFIISGSHAYSRIGESLAECERRYGKRLTDFRSIVGYGINFGIMIGPFDKNAVSKTGEVISGGDSYRFFKVDDYVIAAVFVANKVERIKFIREYQALLSPEEIAAFLSANRGSGSWDELERGKRWFNPLAKRRAHLGPYGLQISSEDIIQRDLKNVQDRKDAENKKQAETLRKF